MARRPRLRHGRGDGLQGRRLLLRLPRGAQRKTKECSGGQPTLTSSRPSRPALVRTARARGLLSPRLDRTNHSQRRGRQAEADRGPGVERHRRRRPVVGDHRLHQVAAQHADMDLVRAAEEDRALDGARQPLDHASVCGSSTIRSGLTMSWTSPRVSTRPGTPRHTRSPIRTVHARRRARRPGPRAGSPPPGSSATNAVDGRS